MALLTFDLEHGYKLGDQIHTEVGFRKLTTEDYIEGQLASEKVVVHDGKGVSYTSDVLYGLELLRRQIEYIGTIKGPFEIKDLYKLHDEDFDLIQKKGAELDKQLAEELEKRGRSQGDG